MSCMRLDVGQGSTPAQPTFIQANVVHSGHSFVAGANATRLGTTDFCSRLKTALTRLDSSIWAYQSLGHGGFRTGHFPDDGTGNQLCLLAASEVDPKIVGGKCNMLVYTEVINSTAYYSQLGGLFATYTPAQVTALVISDLTAYFTARRAAGWTRANGNLIIATAMNLVPFGLETDAQRQCISDVNTWLKTTAIALALIDYFVDMESDPEIGFQKPQNVLTIGNGGDNLHPIDYGHLIYFDGHYPVILQAYASIVGAKSMPWTPLSLPRLQWWVGMEQQGQSVLWDGAGKVFQMNDQGTWKFNFTATGAQRPSWNRVNKSVDSAAGNVMTSLLNVGDCGNPAHDPYSKRINVFACYSCTSTSTVICELGTNPPAGTTAWSVTNETGGPKVASYGNIGQSNATASSLSGTKNVVFTMDHNLGLSQGNLLVEGAAAPGLARTDAPNSNYLGVLPVSLFGRSGGTLGSTMQLRFACAWTGQQTPSDISNLIAYSHAQFG